MTDETVAGNLPEVVLDVRSVTLGELASLEQAAGRSFDELFATKATRLAATLYLARLRESTVPGSPNYGRPPSWPTIMGYRLLDASSSTSPSPEDGPSATSSD